MVRFDFIRSCRLFPKYNLSAEVKTSRSKILKMVSLSPPPSPNQQFYRRKLPDSCISFYSPEGKKIFSEAIATGHMDCYFKLAAQFRTQEEPAYCGLTTLVMILNALEVDPGRVWKGPWRWYHENMLECCVPLQIVEEEGITFDQFICLANCNSVDVNPTRVTQSASEATFKDAIKEYTRRDDAFLVLSYSRRVLGQTGDGHFSAVGGYHPTRDLVLILDVARFKYPPHWVSVESVWNAMKAVDKSTGQPRGYMSMSRLDGGKLLLLFRLSTSLSVTLPCAVTPDIATFVDQWQSWLSEEVTSLEGTEETPGGDILSAAVKKLVELASVIQLMQSILTTQIDLVCLKDLSKEHACIVHQLVNELEDSSIFKCVDEILNNIRKAKPDDEIERTLSKIGQVALSKEVETSEPPAKCRLLGNLRPSHFIAMVILSWPYNTCQGWREHTHAGSLLRRVLEDKSQEKLQLVTEESSTLRKQLSVLLKLYLEQMCHSGKCGMTKSCPKRREIP